MTTRIPLPSDDFLDQLNASLSSADSLERFVRPLLQLLQAVTGLDSTYLTRVDSEGNQQEILLAYNSADGFTMPEGLSVPWEDTLCRRALEEGRPVTQDINACWSDSQAARTLGIRTYISTPLLDGKGKLVGTLCATSQDIKPIADGIYRLLQVFGQLISLHLEREALISQLHQAHEALRFSADTDALTGLPNRRALLQEIDRRLAQHMQNGTDLVVSFIDLDGFKTINDRYGHAIGDRFLAAIADKLRSGQRPEDYCARLGGDEFVTLTSLGHSTPADIIERLRERLTHATSGQVDVGGGLIINYSGASIGLSRAHGETHAVALLAKADAAMYRDKQHRRLDPTQPDV